MASAAIQIQPSSRPGISQNLSLTGTSATVTNPFGSQTYQIRVLVGDVSTGAAAPTSVRIQIGDGTPTATASSMVSSLNIAEYFTVTPGQKIAGILIGGTSPTAILTVTEMS